MKYREVDIIDLLESILQEKYIPEFDFLLKSYKEENTLFKRTILTIRINNSEEIHIVKNISITS